MIVYLIENLNRESFATLSTFEGFFTIMEALVVLFQVAQAIKHFIALDTTVFTRGGVTGGVGGPTRGDTLSWTISRGEGWPGGGRALEAVGGRGRGARFTEAFVEVTGGHRELI